MKKLLSVILSLICVICLCGCEGISEMYSEISKEFMNLIYQTNQVAEIKYETYYIEDPEFNSCYNQLNAKQKNIYTRIRAISEEMTEGFVSLGYNYDNAMKDISIAYSAFLQDNADVFWMPNTYILGTSGTGQGKIVSIAFQYSQGKKQNIYHVRKSQRDVMKTELETVVKEVISQTESLESEYEKEKYIHDYLCDTVTYVEDGPLVNTAYGALVLNSALCEGYAKAFKLLCNEIGIACDLITGRSENEGHMWNRVNIDLKHSYVDVTWDDRKEYKTYSYFNITEEQLIKTHTFAPLFTDMPDDEIIGGNTFNFTKKDCSFSGNTYYEMNDRVLWHNYAETASKKITESAQNGENQSEFMFYSDEIQQIFENDPNAFVGKIQPRLKSLTIHSYIQERNIVILFYE